MAGLRGLGGRNLTIVNNVRRSRLTKSNVALDQDDHSTMTFGHVQKSRQKTDKILDLQRKANITCFVLVFFSNSGKKLDTRRCIKVSTLEKLYLRKLYLGSY